MIALAVAISLHCDGCITVHSAAAKKLGATKEEIAEALGMGISVNAVRRSFTQPARSTHLMRRRKATRDALAEALVDVWGALDCCCDTARCGRATAITAQDRAQFSRFGTDLDSHLSRCELDRGSHGPVD